MRKIQIGQIPAILYGEPSEKGYLYLHGKQGCKEEAEAFADIVCPKGWQVVGIDLPGHGERAFEMDCFDPWHVVPELNQVYDALCLGWNSVCLRANSIGAWFAMLAYQDKPISRSLFVSPVLDMAELIEKMMCWASVTPEMLKQERKIPTSFGETLSWEYYCYAKEHPAERWNIPTFILYAGRDHLVDRKTVERFTSKFNCSLTVMERGEHWFHTEEQLAFLAEWEKNSI